MATLLGGFEPLRLEFRGAAYQLVAREHEADLCGGAALVRGGAAFVRGGAELVRVDAPRPKLHAMLIDAVQGPGGGLQAATLLARPVPRTVAEYHECAAQLLALIERGRAVLLRDLRERTPVILDLAEPEQLSESTALLEDKEWIEVVIEDELGEVLAGVHYELTLPDGSTRHGQSNRNGVIRYDRIAGGSCSLRLLDLDAELWELG